MSALAAHKALRKALPWALALVAALAAGCTLPLQEREPPADARETVPAPVAELVADAQQASAAGENERAAALLERAVGIAPRNPVLWQNLAVVRFREGRFADAENLALRSIDLAATDAELRRRNWQLVAEARRRLGDRSGAHEAAARAKGAGGR